jgi:hypothetical protein
MFEAGADAPVHPLEETMILEHTFTPTAGRPLTFAAVAMLNADGKTQFCVGESTVTDIMSAWVAVDSHSRKFVWPVALRDDDDCIISYVIGDQVYLETWSVANDQNMFDLDQLHTLLPADTFELNADESAALDFV